MEFRKNQIVEVMITDIGDNGEGIGKFEGYTLFVKDAVPGDHVSARLTKVKKNYAYARCEHLITSSEKGQLRSVPSTGDAADARYRQCRMMRSLSTRRIRSGII